MLPFAEALSYIKSQLALDDAMPMKLAISTANDIMGLPQQGSIPDQVQSLVQAIGLPLERLPSRAQASSPPYNNGAAAPLL